MTWECSKKLRLASLNISNQYRSVSVIVLRCWMFNSRADSKKKKKKVWNVNRMDRGDLDRSINSFTGLQTEHHSCLKANYHPAIFTTHWPKGRMFNYVEGIPETLFSNSLVITVNLD